MNTATRTRPQATQAPALTVAPTIPETAPATLSLSATLRAATELMSTGTQPASLKFALYISVCGPNQKLYINRLVARALAPHVNGRLPDRETLCELLRSCRAFWTGRTVASLYGIERLAENGLPA